MLSRQIDSIPIATVEAIPASRWDKANERNESRAPAGQTSRSRRHDPDRSIIFSPDHPWNVTDQYLLVYTFQPALCLRFSIECRIWLRKIYCYENEFVSLLETYQYIIGFDLFLLKLLVNV